MFVVYVCVVAVMTDRGDPSARTGAEEMTFITLDLSRLDNAFNLI